MFQDRSSVKLKGGRGGNGLVDFNKQGVPSGGDGGDGGDIYFVGSHKLYDLRSVGNGNTFESGKGNSGGSNEQTGKKGEDLLIPVPLSTLVYNRNKELIREINKDGQKELILKGGKGGLGNYHNKSKREKRKWHDFTVGTFGRSLELRLVLRLDADIVFLGFPNAGKSSMLKKLTNANPKVAGYAFTTIDPSLGDMDGVKLMDLPGLVEKTHEGKGLGTDFVRHTESAKLVAHFISAENLDPIDAYVKMREEISEIDPVLSNKKEMVILTKIDLLEDSSRVDYIKSEFIQKHNIYIIPTSVESEDGIDLLKESFREEISRLQ